MDILKSPPFWFVIRFHRIALYSSFCGHLYANKDKIDEAMAEQQKALLLQVIPQNYFNNKLAWKRWNAEQDKLKGIQKLYFAIKDHVPTAYAYETTAPDG